MNKIQKIVISTLVLAILAFSSAATMVHASGSLPFQNGQLVAANTLNVAGSSTVGPIALEEAGQFTAYWNALIAEPANSGFDTSSINTVNVAELGSGTAIPALTGGTADIGEMSRPPQSSTTEWGASSMTSMQIWAIGLDSIAIVVSPDMTWFPTTLTTFQVAELFADNVAAQNSNNQGTSGVTGTTPIYGTWGAFLDAYYGGAANVPSSVPAAVLTEKITLAVRDPTSGTFDCFNNYFAAPNGYSFEYKNSAGTVVGSENMAPYTYCEENINVFDTVSQGNTAAGTDAIGFISLGYYETYGSMIGLNIAFNMASPPSGQTASPLIHYYGPSGTEGATSNSAYTGYNVYSWGSYVVPNRANVIYAYSGIQGSGATAPYEAWRYLWEVTPSVIPSTGPLLATGVWIAYMRAQGTTDGGKSDFVADNNYIELNLADFTGGHDVDSNLAPYTPLAGQTQEIPNGQVGSADFFYFVNAYIAYYTQNTYNPYCDILANGHVNSADFFAFVSQYIAYFTTYNPT